MIADTIGCIRLLRDALSADIRIIKTIVMSADSAVTYTSTYTAVSSPYEDLSDIGSPRADDHELLELPYMPEDPYVEAALQAPPSPDYVPGPEEPKQALPLPDYVPGRPGGGTIGGPRGGSYFDYLLMEVRGDDEMDIEEDKDDDMDIEADEEDKDDEMDVEIEEEAEEEHPRGPPLLLPSASHREDRPEVNLPPRMGLGIALGPRYEVGESSAAVAAMDREIRRDPKRYVGYGITDSWDEIVETL
ncbi:hypothetical protein Tco_0418374 [Tanacetum coccineum]